MWDLSARRDALILIDDLRLHDFRFLKYMTPSHTQAIDNQTLEVTWRTLRTSKI